LPAGRPSRELPGVQAHRAPQAGVDAHQARHRRATTTGEAMRSLAAVLAVSCMAATATAAPAAKPPSPGHYAEVNGIRMYYEVYGRGNVLVLLHGGAGNGMQ